MVEKLDKVPSTRADYAESLSELKDIGESMASEPFFNRRDTMDKWASKVAKVSALSTGIGVAVITQDPTSVAAMIGVGHVAQVGIIYKKRLQEQHKKATYTPGLDYLDIYRDAYQDVTERPNLNKLANYTLGHKDNGELASVSVAMKGGYDVDVNIYEAKDSPYYKSRRHQNVSAKRIFEVSDRRAFRKMNRHLSSDPDERTAYHEENDTAGYDDVLHRATQEAEFKTLIQQLREHADDPDVYLDIQGAPYHYSPETREYTPSIVRYSGPSLKEVLAIADDSANMATKGKGATYEIDMVDLTFAHGKHSETVRHRRSKLTAPEYQVDPERPELMDDANQPSLLSRWAQNTAKMYKRVLQTVKEKAGPVWEKIRSRVVESEKDMDEIIAEVQTDGASPPARPEVEAQPVVDEYHTGDFEEEEEMAVYVDEIIFDDEPEEELPYHEQVAAYQKGFFDEEPPKRPLTPEQQTTLRVLQLNDKHTKQSLQSTKTGTAPNPTEPSPSLD